MLVVKIKQILRYIRFYALLFFFPVYSVSITWNMTENVSHFLMDLNFNLSV